MDYILAKQLKDAGFPQKKTPVLFNNVRYEDGGNILVTEGEPVYSPALLELIEACGGTIHLTIHGSEKTSVSKWEHSDEDGTPYHYEGETPQEAVARLWLALQARNGG